MEEGQAYRMPVRHFCWDYKNEHIAKQLVKIGNVRRGRREAKNSRISNFDGDYVTFERCELTYGRW